jgi:hypothetical protein
MAIPEPDATGRLPADGEDELLVTTDPGNSEAVS